MKAFQLFRAVIILGGLLLSACAGAPVSQAVPAEDNPGGDKPLSDVVFTGVIESMSGNQWVIDGQTVQVDPSVLQDGPFMVGDTVKVEARVSEDGSVIVQRIEPPSAVDLAGVATGTPEPSGSGSPVIFDDSGTEAVGAVEAITDTSITLGGQIYPFAPGAEIKGSIGVGAIVKLHFLTAADGTLIVREVEIADPAQVTDANSNDDNSNGTSVNDNSSNDNGNDDNSNANSNDDNGNENGNDNSNDDNSNDDNGNDDDGDDNSNDDNSNGDNKDD